MKVVLNWKRIEELGQTQSYLNWARVQKVDQYPVFSLDEENGKAFLERTKKTISVFHRRVDKRTYYLSADVLMPVPTSRIEDWK